MDYPLTNNDIKHLLKDRVNIVLYPEIKNMKSIDQLLGQYKTAVILYLAGENYGHWTGLFLNHEGLHFIDSYGKLPDESLQYSSRKIRNQDFTYLIKLMIESPYDLYYNDHKLQSSGNAIATCGRHVVNRILHKNLSDDEYFNKFPDDHAVYIYTKKLLGK